MKKVISGILLFAILALSALALVSCGAPNSDPNKAVEALEKNGYKVMSEINDDKTGMIAAYKEGDENNMVSIMYCSDDEFDEAYEMTKKQWDEVKDKDDYKDYEFGKSGKMIYIGHKDAIKAAQ